MRCGIAPASVSRETRSARGDGRHVPDDLDEKGRKEIVAELRLARAGLRRVLSEQGATPRDSDAEVTQLELDAQARHIRELHIALEASRAHYTELFDRAPVALASIDARGRIEVANLLAAELLGVDPPRPAVLPGPRVRCDARAAPGAR